jgi:hypothetical protein
MALAHLEAVVDTGDVRRSGIRGSSWRSRVGTLSAVFMVVLSTSSMLASANASAATKSKKSKVTVATGSIVCKKVTGTVTFSPPDQRGGTTPETQVFSIHASGCHTTKSDVSHVKGASLTATLHRATNACAGLEGSAAFSATFAWSPNSIHDTVATFSGVTFMQNNAGDVGLTIPNTGGTASLKGSFAGKDHGAQSTITAFTNMTLGQFKAACDSTAGLSRYSIVSGTAKFSGSGSATSSTTLVPATGKTVALGTNNPAQGDCTTNTSEAATAVGNVVLTVSASSFRAEIQLQRGSPNTTYGVFMQQVPGSCPQPSANAGTLTTDSTGRGHASTTVARMSSATTFYVQLVPTGVGPPEYTSDRISGVS